MKKVTYRERYFLDKYRCIDLERTAIFTSMFIPDGTSIAYFKVGEYGYLSICLSDVIKIEEE